MCQLPAALQSDGTVTAVFFPSGIHHALHKEKYQLTPLQLLTRIRIEEAQKLLGTTQLHVNIIGENVGYSDPAYFSKQFKKVTGMTALEYRLNHERHV
ncbi:helix-turn-helix transcriptional regulator [Blautia sp. RD014234]|nr:helix-turn-helix transcriptional regulator [Blautia parvula]